MTDLTPALTPDCETWKSVVGYEGVYEVSSFGRVRRPACLDSIGRPRFARMMKLTDNGRGYLSVSLCKNAVAVSARVHTLVAAAFLGMRSGELVVNHIDGNKQNNRASNLEYITQAENEAHANRLGLKAKGERHGRSVIGPDAVRAIRDLYAKGSTPTEISRVYGLHPEHILKIARRKMWKSVA